MQSKKLSSHVDDDELDSVVTPWYYFSFWELVFEKEIHVTHT